VNAVLLVGGVIVLVLLGASPADVNDASLANGVVEVVVVNLACAALCFAKGKLGTGVIGIVVPIVAIVGAIRLARPSSAWGRRRYPDGSRKREKAVSREAAFDARWRSKVRSFQDRVAGFGA
jgi:lysyl-tRNA synthetase class 2